MYCVLAFWPFLFSDSLPAGFYPSPLPAQVQGLWPPCAPGLVEEDAIRGEQQHWRPWQPWFSFSPEGYRELLGGQALLQVEGALGQLGKRYVLRLRWRCASWRFMQDLGYVPAKAELKLYGLRGLNLVLAIPQGAEARQRGEGGEYLMDIPLSRQELETLSRMEAERLSLGFQHKTLVFELARLDFWRQQWQCLQSQSLKLD